MVPMERLELSQDCSYTLLKRTRLPFRHIGTSLASDVPSAVAYKAFLRNGPECSNIGAYRNVKMFL